MNDFLVDNSHLSYYFKGRQKSYSSESISLCVSSELTMTFISHIQFFWNTAEIDILPFLLNSKEARIILWSVQSRSIRLQDKILRFVKISSKCPPCECVGVPSGSTPKSLSFATLSEISFRCELKSPHTISLDQGAFRNKFEITCIRSSIVFLALESWGLIQTQSNVSGQTHSRKRSMLLNSLSFLLFLCFLKSYFQSKLLLAYQARIMRFYKKAGIIFFVKFVSVSDRKSTPLRHSKVSLSNNCFWSELRPLTFVHTTLIILFNLVSVTQCLHCDS